MKNVFINVTKQKYLPLWMISAALRFTTRCRATAQTLFTPPEVRGSEEIWRTEKCIYQWCLLLQSTLLLPSVCLFSSLSQRLEQQTPTMSSVRVKRPPCPSAPLEICGEFTDMSSYC